MKLLKYSLWLTVFFCLSQHLNNFNGLPSFAFPEEFPKIFSQVTSVTSKANQQQNLSVAQLIEKILNNEFQEIQDIWRQLGVKSELFKKGVPVLAKSQKTAIPPNGRPLYVFKFTNEEKNAWQYLFFNIKNRSWNFWGHIDLPNQDGTEPISRMATIEDRTWLIITSKSNSSKPPGMYQDRWYDLNGPKLKEVLEYNVYQDLPLPGFTKRYSAIITQTGISGGTYYIDLSSNITYFSNRLSHPLLETALSISNNVRYIWDRYNQLFKNSQPHPEDFYTYGADEILSHNYLQIKDLATTGNLTQRKVMRDFLNLCNNSTEKQRILKLLR